MEFIVISLSLTVLVLADKQSHNFPNDERYMDGDTYAASTGLPLSYTAEIFEPDFVDNSQPIITLNDNQESTSVPQIKARTESIHRYFRVRRPIKRRKIFHIRRRNLNKDSEPISESLQVNDITPFIDQISQQEYPASYNTPEGSDSHDELDYLPTNNDFSKDSIVYVSHPTTDINQQITPTNKVQTVKESDSSILDTPLTLQEINTKSTLTMGPKFYESNENNIDGNSRNDFQEKIITPGDAEITTPIIEVIIETDTKQLQQSPRMRYHVRQRINNRQRIEISPEILIESPEEQEDSENSVLLLDQIKVPQLITNIETRPGNNKNEFNDFTINYDKYTNEEITPSTSNIEAIDSTPTIPLIELEAVSSTKKIPRLRRIRGRRKFIKNTRINNIRQTDSTPREPPKTSEEITTMKILPSSIELYSPQKDNFEDNSTKEDVLTQSMNTTEEPIPATIKSSTILINSFEVSKSQLPYRRYHARPKFRQHNSIDDFPHQTENMSDIEIATTSTSPQSGFERRIRGRRKFRKNTRINYIRQTDSTPSAPPKTSEEITTMKILASSIELYAPQKDNFEDNSTKEDVLTQTMNTTEEPILATIRSSTTLINSFEVSKSQLPYRRYHARPKFRQHNSIDDVPHQTENMTNIEIATTSTSPQSRFEKVNYAKTTRLPYINYRGRQKFRKLNKGNLSEAITQNIPNLETITTSTAQPNNTENVEKTVTVPETLHQNRHTSTNNIRKLNSRTRKRTRLNPTTANSEITTSLPAVSELDLVSTDKPNNPQQESIRHRKRFRRIKNRTQPTTLRSTTASVGSEEEAIAAEGNENTMSQKQPKQDFKTKSTPPPVPTLSPWYDGFGK